MEANNLNLFYAGILYGQYPEEGKKLPKTGLAVKKLGREFPYLLGRGRGAAGRMLIYYALLPEYRKKALFTGKPKEWKKETAEKMLESAEQKAAVEYGCREQIRVPGLGGVLTQTPLELLAVCLYRWRPFNRLCISLPEDAGEYDLEQILELASPYLPRMRQVVLVGNSRMEEELERYLYEEYGMVLTKEEKVCAGLPWIDFREENTEEISGRKFHENISGDLSRNPGRISRREALKFLDTIVKNGYNT